MKGMPVCILAVFACSCGSGPEDPSGEVDAAQEMRDFVVGLSSYAKQQVPGFIVVPQNGNELLTADLEPDGPPMQAYMSAIDGQGREDLFFGWAGDDEETPASEKEWVLGFLDLAESHGIEVMVTDYCWTPWKVDSSYSWSASHGFVSFAADRRDLDDIPSYPAEPWQVNADPVSDLAGA
ncbi:MAG TPA: hypothetical protein PLF04_05750, partial [Candidatus Fermentibacter daniensis]|nr:hypothetical protein [Candidatus Fermentibacter daniensis]